MSYEKSNLKSKLNLLIVILGIVSSLIAVFSLTCSKFDFGCVLSPTPSITPEEIKSNQEFLDSKLQLNETWQAFKGLKFDTLYPNSDTSIVNVVAIIENNDDILVDSLNIPLSNFNAQHDRNGSFLLGAYTDTENTAHIIFYNSQNKFVKRVFQVFCSEPKKDALTLSNLTYLTKDRKIIFDLKGKCENSNYVNIGNKSLRLKSNKVENVTAQLDRNFNLKAVNYSNEFMKAERVAEGKKRFESCSENEPINFRNQYPTVKSGVIYCWYFTEYSKKIDDNLLYSHTYYSGGSQRIRAFAISSEKTTLLVDHECPYAPVDSDLYYAADFIGTGKALSLNSTTSIVGCETYNNVGFNEEYGKRGIKLIIANVEFLFKLNMLCNCTELDLSPTADFNDKTFSLSINLKTDSDVIYLNKSKVQLIKKKDTKGSQNHSLRVIFDSSGAINKINL